MLEPIYTTRFRKQFKLMQKQGKQMSKLHEVMGMIINNPYLLSVATIRCMVNGKTPTAVTYKATGFLFMNLII